MSTEELDEHVAAIFGTLAGLPAPAVYTLAAGLELAEEPAAWLAMPIRYHARSREHGETEPNPLAVITMRSALRKADADGTLVSRLADAETPFWSAVEDALVAMAAERLPVEV